MKKSTKKKSKLKLREEADRIFSIYIRLRDRDFMGLTKCFTCDHRADMKKMQNGHYVPRQYLAVRYDERNCNAQCFACNMHYNGQPARYALHLIELYGNKIISELNEKSKEVINDFDYENIIKVYSDKIDDMGLSYLI